MPNNDLPVTADAKQSPARASDLPQSTTPPETEVSAQTTMGLDLRGYDLSERLGGGGMGDVYRAGDPALGRDLAVKVMKADLQGYAAAEQRFLREARVTGSLQHPGIVPIHNLGRLADGRLHYTMRLVRGRTFADILRDEAGQPDRLPALLTIFEKVCQAVAYAHSKQVIHRDLKPSNVMVGRFGEVQVMDWGLAKLLTAEDEPAAVGTPADRGGTRIHTEAEDTPLAQTRMGREMGTPAYMPPEQALGEWDMVDERADVFALGAILCEILTGQPPYTGHDSAEPLRKAKRGDLAEALARLGNCVADAALVQMCHACLAPEREGRPRDAEQVAQRMAVYQAEVQERLRHAELERTAAQVKAREERKRRRWMGAAVMLLLAGAALSVWQAVRATKAEGWARENEDAALTAAEAERQAKDLAQNRLGQIEKVNDVLTSIIRDLDPQAEAKGGFSLRQQLSGHVERAAAQLDDAAVGDPVGVARLQSALGRSLTNLGQAKRGIEMLSKAGMTLEAQLGADHPDTLSSRDSLGLAYSAAGRVSDAIRLHEQTLKQREVKLGPDHPDTLSSRTNLATAYWAVGRQADAIPLLEQNVKQYAIKLGADHHGTLTTRNNLANAYLSAGRTADAIRLHEQNLKQFEAQLGTDHPETLASRNNLATSYKNAGRTADAIRLYEQSIKQYEAKLGADHPNSLQFRYNLATAYTDAGRTNDAIRMHEETLKRREAKLGSDHPDTLSSRNSLAGAYKDASRPADAIPLYEQILKQREAKLGADHPDTLDTRTALATAYWSAGRNAEAIPLFERTLKKLEAKLGLDHVYTLTCGNNLANAYQSAGRTADAIRLYEQTLKQSEAKLGTDHLYTLTYRHNLAAAYTDAGRTNDAIRLHEQTLKQREAKLGPDHPDTLQSRHALAGVYENVSRLDEAIRLYEQTLKQRETKLGRDHPDTLSTRHSLAVAYGKSGRRDEAIHMHEQTLKQREAKLGHDHPDTLDTLASLSFYYRSAGRLKESIAGLEQALEQGRKHTEGLPKQLAWIPGALAEAYEQAGEFAKAEALYRDAVEQTRKRSRAEDVATASQIALLGLNLLHQHKYSDAEPLLRNCLKIRQTKLPEDWTTFNTQSMLGESLLGQKKYTQAEPLLVQGYEGMQQRQDKIPPAYRQVRLSEALERLVQLYETTQQKDKAADWRKKLQETKAAKKKSKP